MLMTKSVLEEMVGYGLEQLDIQLIIKPGTLYTYDINFEQLAKLFERVRELSYKDGQKNILEWARDNLQ